MTTKGYNFQESRAKTLNLLVPPLMYYSRHEQEHMPKTHQMNYD